MGFLHETSLIWVISMGVKLRLVYFRSLHICKNYHINAKYMIYDSGIEFVSFYDVSTGYLKCSDSVGFFAFHLIGYS